MRRFALGVFSPVVFASLLAGAPVPAGASPPPATTAAPVPPSPDARGPWWQGFGDARLDALVAQGLDGNLDLGVARSRVDESRAVVKQSLAPLLPTLSWDSSLNMAPTDSLGFQFGGIGGGMGPQPPELYWSASSALNLGYEIDLTGRNTLGFKASRRDVDAAGLDVSSQEVGVAVGIVSAYFDIIAAEAQLRVVEDQIHTASELLTLTEQRLPEGLSRMTDVLQQRQQLAANETLRPQAEAQLRGFRQQLAVLLGEAPNTAHEVADRLPTLRQTPTVQAQEDVSRRPDLRAATVRVSSSRMREKNARRQFAPTVRLNASAGAQAIRITDLNDQFYWGMGATLSVPLYQGGRVFGSLRQREAQTRTAERELSRQTLVAVREVEDALARERERRAAMEAYRAQAEAAGTAYEALRARYLDGEADVLNLLNALNTRHSARLNVVTAQRDVLAARISLHQALGHGATETSR